jgi:hypothetical protein
MNLKQRLAKIEGVANHESELRYVIRIVGDESLSEAKAAKGWQHVPDDKLFIIHRVIIRPNHEY